MKIQDLVPRKSKINLKMIIDDVEQDRQYILMPATIKTILDLSKILERNIEDIFTNPSAEEISQIANILPLSINFPFSPETVMSGCFALFCSITNSTAIATL